MSRVSKTLDLIALRSKAKVQAEAVFVPIINAPRSRVLVVERVPDTSDALALDMLIAAQAQLQSALHRPENQVSHFGGLKERREPEAKSLYQPVKKRFYYKRRRTDPDAYRWRDDCIQ